MTTPEQPGKMFYRIQEVADRLGVEAYVLRYWETRFPMLRPEKDGADQRRYRARDIEVAERIQQLLHVEKYTIAGAVDRLRQELGGSLPEPVPPAPKDQDPEPEKPREILNPDERLSRLLRVREELGLLRREIEEWRDELG